VRVLTLHKFSCGAIKRLHSFVSGNFLEVVVAESEL
jgi:hypothetical protein